MIFYITRASCICQIKLSHILFYLKKRCSLFFCHKDNGLGLKCEKNTVEFPKAVAMFVRLTDLVVSQTVTWWTRQLFALFQLTSQCKHNESLHCFFRRAFSCDLFKRDSDFKCHSFISTNGSMSHSALSSLLPAITNCPVQWTHTLPIWWIQIKEITIVFKVKHHE